MRPHQSFAFAIVMLATAYVASSHVRPVAVSAQPVSAIGDTLTPPVVLSTLQRACFDCHSDHTRWPWYSSLPVASSLIEHDVAGGRAQLNFSRWTGYNRFDRADLLDKACEMATKRQMPPWQYRLLHGEAKLSDLDLRVLCAWMQGEAARLVEDSNDHTQ